MSLRRIASAPLLRVLEKSSLVLRHTPLTRFGWLNRLQARVAVWLHGKYRARVGSFTVHFHPADRVHSKRLILYGGHESEGIALLCSFARPGDPAMDVGANIGLYTLHMSRAVGPEGMVLAVEPDPENVHLLRRNIRVNDCRNVRLAQVALGERNDDVELYRVEHHRGNLSLADLQGTGSSVRVRLRVGSELLEEFGMRPRLVKIDVEGYEPQVYAGLGYAPDVLMVECVPSQWKAFGADPLAFLTRLEADGYSLSLVDPMKGWVWPAGPQRVVDFARRSERVHNVLALQPGTRA